MKIFQKKFITNLFCISLLFVGFNLLAQENGTSSTEMSVAIPFNDSEIQWNPAPEFFPGCSFTILHGDIVEPNLDFFFKVEPNTEIITHTHKSAERMILVSGEMEVQYEGEEAQVLKAGTYAYGPANKPHRAKCLDVGPCVLFIAMIEPFDAVPID